MKANELRIGNWIKYNDKEFQATFASIPYAAQFPNDYAPIPLTEEWLEKFGFEFYSGCWVNNSCDFDLLMEEPYLFSVLLNGRLSFSPNIEYVHQLQNLFFALTGEELTIKERAAV